MAGYWARRMERGHAQRLVSQRDAGYTDEKGFMFIKDRTKDMIVSETIYRVT